MRNLTGSEQALTTKQEGKDALREALEGRRILVILDDVWKVDDVEAFLVDVPPARLRATGFWPSGPARSVRTGWAKSTLT